MLPALHFYYEGLFDFNASAVDDHTLGVRQIPLVCVLKFDGVNDRLKETDGQMSDITNKTFPAVSVEDLLTIPSRTLANTTCLLSSHGALASVMKNWEPLVSGPAFAMLTHPAPRCFSLKFSSANVWLWILLPVQTHTHRHWNTLYTHTRDDQMMIGKIFCVL